MDRRISYLTDLMVSNLRHQWTVDEMSQRVNISSPYLHRLFKEQLGVSPILYLRGLRLERARRLLENSFIRIKDIRLQIGITDAGRFASDFKAQYGVTPSDYRRHISTQTEADNEQIATSTRHHRKTIAPKN